MVALSMAENLKESKKATPKSKRAAGTGDKSPREKMLQSSPRQRNYQFKNCPNSPTIECVADVAFARFLETLKSPKSQVIFYNQRMQREIQDGGLGPVPSKVDSSCHDSSDSEDMFAGSKYEHPPAADVLPKPPTSWMVNGNEETTAFDFGDTGTVVSDYLKMLLKVQA